MMGIPEDDYAKVFGWTNTILGVGDPEYGSTYDDLMAHSLEMFTYAQTLGENRRAHPTDDITSGSTPPRAATSSATSSCSLWTGMTTEIRDGAAIANARSYQSHHPSTPRAAGEASPAARYSFWGKTRANLGFPPAAGRYAK
jgi:hypothetical protein